MKRIFTTLTILFALLLAGCSAVSTPAPAPVEAATAQPTVSAEAPAIVIPTATIVVRPALDVAYENALASRLLLSLGTLKLAETSTPVTPGQAPQLLMLWQALDNLTQSDTSAQAEVDALLVQIEAAYTPEQIMAINAMRLIQTELQTWAQLNGVAVATGGGQGQGQGQGGGVSAEARATKQAQQGVTSGGDNGLSAAVTQALLAYLQSIQP
ncbi:MAG: hypothetical protein A2139_03150 [Desulfobacca sp. RBG_16_60_12]|nr:MAG: hypothetical protein A2139_03150 [Desulfobacca sp. RBG_16_60_12]